MKSSTIKGLGERRGTMRVRHSFPDSVPLALLALELAKQKSGGAAANTGDGVRTVTPEQRAALKAALEIHVAGHALSSCDATFDFGAWQMRQGAINDAVSAVVGVSAPRYVTIEDVARWLLLLGERPRGKA